LKNVIVTSKVIRRRQQRSIDSKDILKQSESEKAPNIQEATGSNSIQVSSAILQDQVTFFIIINFKNMGLLNARLFLMNNLKIEKPKERWNTRPF
jgi:hypothetical protein